MPKRTAPALLNCDEFDVMVPKWIWYPYIPANASTMLFGTGGVGKSYMSCAIAAALSCGRPLPGQVGALKNHKVLLMSAEDSPQAVIKPRLIKCGAQLSNVFIPAEPFTLDDWGLKLLKLYMDDSAASVVIIDPIVHYMGGKIDMNKMNEVRAITGELHQRAMGADCAIILVHHARKGDEGKGYEQAAGSADFVNSTRSVLYAHRAADETCVVSHVKTNYGTFGAGLAYEITEGGFTWLGEYDDKDVLQPKKSTKREAGVAFLKEALASGPLAALELMKMAEDEGVHRATLIRSKAGVAESIMRYDGETRVWFWRLIGDESEPTGLEPPGDTSNVDAYLRRTA